MSKSEQPAQVGSTDGLGPFPWGDDIDAWLEVSDAAQVAADIRAFVAQEVAAERKRCAKLCEDISDEYQRRDGWKYAELRSDAEEGASKCAAAIRGA